MTARDVTADALRPLVFSIALRMVGSAGEAEDLVQEAYLRLHREGDVRAPKAFLTTVVTRLAIDHLRSARVRRETYTGDWLPAFNSPISLFTVTTSPAQRPGAAAGCTLIQVTSPRPRPAHCDAWLSAVELLNNHSGRSPSAASSGSAASSSRSISFTRPDGVGTRRSGLWAPGAISSGFWLIGCHCLAPAGDFTSSYS